MNVIRLAIFILVFGFGMGCGTPGTLVPDLTKIRLYSYELQRAEPLEAPYVVHFSKGGQDLYYVASVHSNHESSPTFQLIGRLFSDMKLNRTKFSVAIIEGYPRSCGQNDPSFLKQAHEMGEGGFFKGGEPAYTALLAERVGIPFIGGEPPEPDIVRAVEAKKERYTAQDILGFYFVRQVPTLQRDKTLQEKTVEEAEKAYRDFMPGQAATAGLSEEAKSFAFADFQDWYRTRNEKPFTVEALNPEEAAPLADGPCFTQRLSSVIGNERDKFIVRTIADFLNSHHHVLVVYGSGHMVTQRAALEAMLGKPFEEFKQGHRGRV